MAPFSFTSFGTFGVLETKKFFKLPLFLIPLLLQMLFLRPLNGFSLRVLFLQIKLFKRFLFLGNHLRKGWFKLNTDGSCHAGMDGYGDIAAGGILRNDQGMWLKGFACFIIGCGNSLLAKLWAILLGINLAREANFDPIIVESDCLIVVSLLNSDQASSTHHYASIINLCRSRLATFSDFKVVHVVREGN